VRSFGKPAIVLAIVSISTLMPAYVSAQTGSTAGHRVAVIDVAYIFKTHPGIRAEVATVEQDLKSFDATLKTKQTDLKAAAEQLKTFKVGSAEYSAQEQQVALMESKLRIDMASKRRQLAETEAQIYFQNYKRITDGVKFMANHYKINLVLRYNSDQMDLEKPDTVIRGVMKNIVYHDEDLDMTKAIMQYLTQAMEKQATAQDTGVQRN